jgi:hypothetical protein
MMLHAIYDIPANIISYADSFKKNSFITFLDACFYPLYGVILMVAIVFIVIPCIRINKKELATDYN